MLTCHRVLHTITSLKQGEPLTQLTALTLTSRLIKSSTELGPPYSSVLGPVVSILTVGHLLCVGAEILLAVRGSVHGRVRVVRAGEDDGGGHVVELVVGRETTETEE